MRIREWRITKHTLLSLGDIARKLNPTLRGWDQYFGRSYPTELRKLYEYFDERLGAWLRKKHKHLRNQHRHSLRILNKACMRYNYENILKESITISIVSHGHGSVIWKLVTDLLEFPEIARIIITINTPESIPLQYDEKVKIIINTQIYGFGRNHNEAFKLCVTPFFCVLNPDITFSINPFSDLLLLMVETNAALISPVLMDMQTGLADNLRKKLTLSGLIKRMLKISKGNYYAELQSNLIYPDWVCGAFMLFCSEVYENISGFDEKYFMYCEDADICSRLRMRNYIISAAANLVVIHNSARLSKRNIFHAYWHIVSLIRYFLKQCALFI